MTKKSNKTLKLSASQRQAAIAIVEEAGAIKPALQSMAEHERMACLAVLGPVEEFPDFHRGPLPCVRISADLKPEIILPEGAALSTVVHEYAHWYAFTFGGPAVLMAEDDVHERWASYVVEHHKRGLEVMNPGRSCQEFFRASRG